MKFQNCIQKHFERTHGWTHGQTLSNMPLQLFQSWGHKNVSTVYTDFCHIPEEFKGDVNPDDYYVLYERF